MTREEKAEFTSRLKDILKPGDFKIFDRRDHAFCGDYDAFALLYNCADVIFSEDVDKQAVIDECVLGIITAKYGHPIVICEETASNVGYPIFWFKRVS